jgi:hypothetical protein
MEGVFKPGIRQPRFKQLIYQGAYQGCGILPTISFFTGE